MADVANKKHNLGADTLTIALVNTPAPTAANAVLADLTGQISYTNLPTSRNLTGVTSTQTSGTYHLIAADPPALTATGGSVAPFRYVVLYNSTAAGGPLIGWWDNTATVTMNVGGTFTVDLDNVNGILTLA